MRNATEELLRIVSQMHAMDVNEKQIEELEKFMSEYFDELELSPLWYSLGEEGELKNFNAYMALMNKYNSFPKGLIPFELDLQEYVLADKMMERVKL